jgi:hypothetical protein
MTVKKYVIETDVDGRLRVPVNAPNGFLFFVHDSEIPPVKRVDGSRCLYVDSCTHVEVVNSFVDRHYPNEVFIHDSPRTLVHFYVLIF